MTAQTIRRDTATSQQNTTQATPQRDKTTTAHKSPVIRIRHRSPQERHRGSI